jgi:hypothetical protein
MSVWEFSMRKIAFLAVTAMLLCAPVSLALAQNASDSGSSAPTAPAPAAPAPSAQTPTDNAPASTVQSANPAAADTPSTTAPSSNARATTATDNTSKTKKKKAAGVTRRQEVEKSIDSGTVPSRYRNAVPKEYQQYIPFSKD